MKTWIPCVMFGASLILCSACSDDGASPSQVDSPDASISNSGADTGVVDTGTGGGGDAGASDVGQDVQADQGVDAEVEVDEPWPGYCVRESDWDNNGRANSRTVRSYDALGFVLTESQDYDADGAFEEIETWTYADELPATYLLDINADGDADQISTYRYNDRGLLVETEIDGNTEGFVPLPPDGVVDTRVVGTWNAMDAPLTLETDFRDDGEVDELWSWRYEGESRSIAEQDKGVDGVIELQLTYDREDTANGFILRFEADGDMGNSVSRTPTDGLVDYRSTEVFEDGLKRSEEVKTFLEGEERVTQTFTFFYDEVTGRLDRVVSVFTGGDFSEEEVRFYAYTTRGNVASISNGLDDGSIDNVTTFDYGCWGE